MLLELQASLTLKVLLGLALISLGPRSTLSHHTPRTSGLPHNAQVLGCLAILMPEP